MASPAARIIYHNELGTNSAMFNALSTNPDALALLVASPLRSETFDGDAYPESAQPMLGEQLTDIWAQKLFSYLVACALPGDQVVSWYDPTTRQTRTFRGERGFCPAWHDDPLTSMNAEDRTACQELVSACLLASNNAFERKVRISMRGKREARPLPWQAPVQGGRPALASLQPCPGGVPSGDRSQRDCGWESGLVGLCQQGEPIAIHPPDTCASPIAVRVCKDGDACDSMNALVFSPDICVNGMQDLSLTCPDSGELTIMSDPPGTPGESPVAMEGGRFTVSEEEYFTFREGAFYGNLLAVESIDPRIAVRVDKGKVVYSFAATSNQPRIDRPVYDVACNDLSDAPETVRAQEHEAFLDAVAATQPGQDIIIHRNLYACWDPGWTEGAAYAASRICAGPAGRKFCVAQAVGSCWKGSLETAPGAMNQFMCDTDDTLPDRGDRDYGVCRGSDGTVWNHPITVFLAKPCDLVPDKCSTSHVAAVSAGGFHTCVRIDGGQEQGLARCWGRGDEGQLGYGTFPPPQLPRIGDDEAPASAGFVDVGSSVAQIVAGGSHTCAVLAGPDAGKVRCWGRNHAGQLGYAHTLTIGDDEAPATAGFVDVGGPVKELALGAYHTCALLQDGSMRCWGLGDRGQLGYGHVNSIGDDEVPSTAGPVDVGGMVERIVAGDYHTCALLADHSVRCWGYNASGQLGLGHVQVIGDGETPSSAGPVAVGEPVDQLTAGSNHTCARLASGAVRCWGENFYGQLGYGHVDNIGDDELPDTAGSVGLSGTVIAIDAGGDSTCALLADGHVQCWGRNQKGQLGYGHTNNIGDDESPAAAGYAPIGMSVTGLSVATNHVCAMDAHHRTRCWGSHQYGQLGLGAGLPGTVTLPNIGDDEKPYLVGTVPVF